MTDPSGPPSFQNYDQEPPCQPPPPEDPHPTKKKKRLRDRITTVGAVIFILVPWVILAGTRIPTDPSAKSHNEEKIILLVVAFEIYANKNGCLPASTQVIDEDYNNDKLAANLGLINEPHGYFTYGRYMFDYPLVYINLNEPNVAEKFGFDKAILEKYKHKSPKYIIWGPRYDIYYLEDVGFIEPPDDE